MARVINCFASTVYLNFVSLFRSLSWRTATLRWQAAHELLCSSWAASFSAGTIWIEVVWLNLDRKGWHISFVMKDTSQPDKRRKYDVVFCAKALRLAEQNRSIQAAARALNIDPKCIYQWQKAAQTPVAAALRAALDPATATELR